MTVRIEVSSKLVEWGTRAGFTLTPQDDGRAEFWPRGGEIRYLVGVRDDGWLVITLSERLGPEEFELAATSMDTIERYFFGRFGRSIRSNFDLPLVHLPTEPDEIAPGFVLDTRVFDGVERLALIDANGDVIAISSGDKISGTMDLVKLSLYLTASVDDIVASCLDPEGKPLFTPR